MVAKATYSTSITAPEGGLDAIMQIIVCKEMIGWRDVARRILVYSSDNTVHVAGDAKLAQIFAPNDGICHLDPITGEYTETVGQDFPTIGHLNSKVIEHSIFPIFAIDSKKKVFYEEMAKDIKGATVGVLAASSSNIVAIIKNQYEAITSKIELIDTAPGGIDILYTAHCGDDDHRPGEKVCTGLSLGEVVSFDLEITATSCEKSETRGFTVKPFGFEDNLLINIEVLCSCGCEKTGEPNSEKCSNGNGTYACGICYCNQGRYGQVCECDVETGGGEGVENCVAPDSTVVCSGRGECFCGQCQCFARQNPKEVVSGPFCQCDNFSCDRYEGELCGGSERGKCVCDEKTWESTCLCNKGYAGSACQCPDTDKACEASTGLICNGYGDCVCGECQCDPNSSFRGATCEECGVCVGDCGLYRECVLCTVFNEGKLSPEECAKCSMLIVVEDKLPPLDGPILCETLNQENCTVRYYYESLENDTVLVHVKKDPVCPQRQLVATDPWIIVVAIIAAILLIGLLLILLFRLYLNYLYKREYSEFMKDQKQAKWEQSTNPIYRPSTTKHTNPMYGKAVQMSYPESDEPKTEL